jgi:hypothetical protein
MMSKISSRTLIKSRHRGDTGSIDDTGASGGSEVGIETISRRLPGVGAVNRASLGELVRMPGGRYEPFLGRHEQAVEAELSFLRRHLLDHSRADRPAPPPRNPRRTEADGHERDRAVRRDNRA